MYIYWYLLLSANLFLTVKCESYTTERFEESTEEPATCVKELRYMTNNSVVSKDQCKEKPCFIRCCGEYGLIFVSESGFIKCNRSSYYPNMSLNNVLKLYKKNIREKVEMIENSDATVQFLVDKDMPCKDSVSYTTDFKAYILENGAFIFDRETFFDRWVEFLPQTFCMEYTIDIDDNQDVSNPYITFFYFNVPKQETGSDYGKLYSAIGFLISCFFILLVLLTYIILPELRSFGGLVLMANLITQFLAFLIIAIGYIADFMGKLTEEMCLFLGYAKYYTFLSSFFWMTAKSFEIWRYITKSQYHTMSRRMKILKMTLYGITAWGTPAIMTIMVDRIGHTDFTNMPWIIKPSINKHMCFFAEKLTLMFYVYIPILILISCNLVFFVLTIVHIWLIQKQLTKQKESKNNKRHKTRFMLFVKLSVVMGLSWVLEVVTTYLPDNMEWFKYICDTYIIFCGVVIFYFFVFQKSVLRKLCKKFSRFEFARRMENRLSLTSGAESTRKSRKSSIVKDAKLVNNLSTIFEPDRTTVTNL